MQTISYAFARMPWCELLVATGDRGLVAVQFVSKQGREGEVAYLSSRWRDAKLVESKNENLETIAELDAYGAGHLREFTMPLDLRGTEFQLAAWRELLKIPYGETRSYGDIARAIDHHQAFRAVGMANHSNPIAIIVPCHRVIGSNRGLTGYGGGLELKKALLELEQSQSNPTKASRESLTLPLWN